MNLFFRNVCCVVVCVSPLFSLPGVAATVAPEVEWSYETGGKIYASPVLADIDGDGATEIIVAASRARRMLCFDGQGNLRWDFHLKEEVLDGFHATPSVVDYDGDGKKEVFFLTRDGSAGCLDYQGRLVWRVSMGDEMDYTGPVVADINADGRIEILFGSESGTLYCLDDTGQALWHYQADGAIRGIPAVAQLGDSPVMRVYITFGGGLMACFDHDGNLVWSQMDGQPRKERRSNVAVGDLNGNGRLEVVSATEDFQVIAYDAENGEEQWRFKGKGSIDNACSFALVDFEGKGMLDVLAGDKSGHVYRIRNGELLWAADAGAARLGGIVQGPSVGDVDGDGELEILVCARSSRLVCFSAQGEEEWDFKTTAQPLTTPALGDVDGDGEVEIIFTGKDRTVRSLSLGGKYVPEKLPWPMLAHDAQLSGNVHGAAFTPAPAVAVDAIDAPLSLVQFAPLKIGKNRIRFKFANQSIRPRRLDTIAEITRPDGSVVSQVVSETCAPGEAKEAAFDLFAATGGKYQLAMRLVDTGGAQLLGVVEEEATFNAFEAENKVLQTLTQDGYAAMEKLADEAVRAAAHSSLEKQVNAASDALMKAMPQEGGAAMIAQVQGALDLLRREVARLYAAAATPATAGAFAAVPETTLRKVFRDEALLSTKRAPKPVQIQLARNEYESAQLVVVPLWQDLNQLAVQAVDLKQEDGDTVLRADQIEIYGVGYVKIGEPEYNFPIEKVGFYPDVLEPNAQLDVPFTQEAQPFYITVHTDADTAPGKYSGVLKVTTANAGTLNVPLEVDVWDFALPEQTTLKTSFWMKESQVQRFYKYEGRTPFEVRKRFYDLHLKHRMSPIKNFPLGGGNMLEDFEYLMAHGQNCFFIPIPDLFDGSGRDEYKEKVLATQALLKEKGWEDKALYYAHDEVAVMARHIIPQVLEMNQWVKENLPQWPVLETSAPEQALVGGVDTWCPVIGEFDPNMVALRKEAGENLWFYTVWDRPGIMIDFPAIDHRLIFWQCWKYGAQGYLYWGTTHWADNVSGEERWPERPWMPWNSQPGHHGCGYLIYPGPNGVPWASIRMSIARDGIEDYEYFALLRNLLQNKGAAVPEALRKEVEAALAIDEAIIVDNEHFTQDSALLSKARVELAQLISALQAL